MEPLITLNDLMERLQCSRMSIVRGVESGNIPKPIRIGRLVRWMPATIEAWLAEREKEGGGNGQD